VQLLNDFKTKGKVMPFHKERRLFFKKDRGLIQKSLQVILLSGVFFFGFAAHFFDVELSRFAFAPHGFKADQTDKVVKDRQIILTRVSREAPLTASSPKPTTANLRIVTPEKDTRSDYHAPVRVRVISHAQSDYSEVPTGIVSNGVNMPESKKPPDIVEAVRVQGDDPYSATSSSLANEPSETELTTVVKVDQDFDKARLQPKVAKSRRVSVRSRRSRAVVRRKRSRKRTSPPAATWADQYFQK
jgi:hypothetical protein